MPIFNFLKKQFKRILILLFFSFMIFHWAKAYFPENEIAKKYVEQYVKILWFSENFLKEKIPGLENYLLESEKAKQEKAYDELVN